MAIFIYSVVKYELSKSAYYLLWVQLNTETTTNRSKKFRITDQENS